MPYQELLQRIHAADVCLGIFGATEKAARVIPNKVFQIIASGRPLITADTPAARELLEPGPAIQLVPAADPDALRRAAQKLREAYEAQTVAIRHEIQPQIAIMPLKNVLTKLSEHTRVDAIS